MGAVADAALAAGGKVIGVMPADLVNQEIGHRGLTELRIVNSMHERKWAMAELSDGFLCLPGGPGTFEEIFEQWTWALLGFHAKPCGFVNVNGYYDLMRATVQQMADKGFTRPAVRRHADLRRHHRRGDRSLPRLRPAAAQVGRGPGGAALLGASGLACIGDRWSEALPQRLATASLDSLAALSTPFSSSLPVTASIPTSAVLPWLRMSKE